MDTPTGEIYNSAKQDHAEARRLFDGVRASSGIAVRVYSVSASCWVAAPSISAAVLWHAEGGTSEPLSDEAFDAREVSLFTNVASEGGEKKPLWYLIADHFRESLKDWNPTEDLPKQMFEPFLIAIIEGEAV